MTTGKNNPHQEKEELQYMCNKKQNISYVFFSCLIMGLISEIIGTDYSAPRFPLQTVETESRHLHVLAWE